jgi:hypothetical protein
MDKYEITQVLHKKVGCFHYKVFFEESDGNLLHLPSDFHNSVALDVD